MIAPGQVKNLTLYRWQPNVVSFAFVGLDFTGAAFKSQIRAFRDAEDPAMVTLENATAGTQGISVAVVTTEGVPTSTVTLQYDEATVEGIAFPNPKGTDPEYSWDLVIDPTDDLKRRWLEGPVTIRAGATQI
ncbi:MAG: hypothetical protein B7Y36_18730 [Novosphingobium sp. 28-62-57]|uniref:hypothetical protein n=1 Tax=Novosphingobium sp. 28-62-57 TaxID=1970409 RepID=UPI000BD2A0BE|nr:hypothetical protein [Novosphingobium sp. 28-62-57]OYZ07827.1 MAG: hypothetical protein B7Y36_18730 [Novosphingobium sp. 28-62-57]OYZ46567.1 MAG: hypothetical protein B7Y31_00700 [Novosphingobium sp. 16-62-11]OZA36621.1 MAG: hypothetical protein B7X92_05785 [Novosphingobium sp. 17-62-9]HQS96678.1 hypothetical protein [Novosphingobium sp.]